MSSERLDCYILPTKPAPLLLPIECVAEVVAKPVIDGLEKAPAKWMQGHVNWRNQRLPVMDYAGLHTYAAGDEKSEEEVEANDNQLLVVLNPIPGAARKAYSAMVCSDDVQQITIEPNLEFMELPDGVDKRYVEGVIGIDGKPFLVPKLTAIAVAFSYF